MDINNQAEFHKVQVQIRNILDSNYGHDVSEWLEVELTSMVDERTEYFVETDEELVGFGELTEAQLLRRSIYQLTSAVIQLTRVIALKG